MDTSAIWNRFNGELEQFIVSKVSNKETAKDLLQDVFMKIHKNKHQLKTESKLTSWVYQITRNTIIDFYRSRKEIIPEELNLKDTEESKNNQFLGCLLPFVDQLPEKYQEAIRLTSLEGISQKDYAKKKGISYSAAKSRVQRGREKLKELFTACCDIESDKYGNIISDPKPDCNC